MSLFRPAGSEARTATEGLTCDGATGYQTRRRLLVHIFSIERLLLIQRSRD